MQVCDAERNPLKLMEQLLSICWFVTHFSLLELHADKLNQ